LPFGLQFILPQSPRKNPMDTISIPVFEFFAFFWRLAFIDQHIMKNDLNFRSQFPRTEVAMVRIMMALGIALLAVRPVAADELDKEFGDVGSKTRLAAPKSTLASADPSGAVPSLKEQSDAKASMKKGSELDDESPAQAYRGGWGGGWGRRWGGWGRGWYGGGRGWGWGGWGRGWGGWWGRGWGWNRGWGWGGWGGGWPYYASLSRPYIGYGYGSGYYYPYGGYCW
jgi:hypothetical protein